MRFRFALMCVLAVMLGVSQPPLARAADVKPYDRQLLRVSEILGAVHYLRELCGANEGQIWRKSMQTLLRSEGTSAVRRAKFARKFNLGYQSYRRTYKSCTPTAQVAVKRFLTEGANIAADLVKNIP